MSISELGTYLDKWLLAGCFLILFFLFIFKGVPWLLKLYERILNHIHEEQTKQIMKITEEQTLQNENITDAFREAIREIAQQLVETISKNHEENMRFQGEHSARLEETNRKIDSLILKSKRKNA